MKKKRKYIYLEKCLIIRILQIYIFSFYDFLFFISLSFLGEDVLSVHDVLLGDLLLDVELQCYPSSSIPRPNPLSFFVLGRKA